MRIVGVRQSHTGSGVEVAALADGGDKVTVIASLADFWADPAWHMSQPPTGPTLATASVEQVPPVLPDARVLCIGLNYLEHAAEGSYRDQQLPSFPTLFARWTHH